MQATYTISNNTSPVFNDLIQKLQNVEDTPSSPNTKNIPVNVKNVNVMRCTNTQQEDNNETTTQYRTYKLVNYNQEKMSLPMIGTAGVLKSVLFTNENKMISFSPPKSQPYEVFTDMFGDIQKLQVEEFVDGTMVSLFWDEQINDWEIMTRRKIGANNYYYTYTHNDTQPTFRSMFYNAIETCNLDIQRLDKSNVYSFVLCHPDNRIITKTSTTQLYLIEVYSIENIIDEENLSYTITVVNRNNTVDEEPFRNSIVKTPQQFSFDTYEDMMSSLDNLNKDPSIPKGYILRDTETGTRTRVVCKLYTQIMTHMKCNYADMRYMYLNLRSEKLTKKYLEHFPEHKDLFNYYHNLLCDYTHFLFAMYIDCYMKKTNPLNTYPANVRTHMFSIHKIYIERNKEKSIDMKDVMTYVNNMDVPLLYSTLFTITNR